MCEVLVQFVLEGDEGVIVILGEFDIFQNCICDERVDFCGIGQNSDYVLFGEFWFDDVVVGEFLVVEEDVEVEGDIFEVEYVILVGGDFDYEFGGGMLVIDYGVFFIFGIVVEFDVEFEVKVFEFFGGVFMGSMCGQWEGCFVMEGLFLRG